MDMAVGGDGSRYRRAAMTYGLLVVVPALLAVAVLVLIGGRAAGRVVSPATATPILPRLLAAVALIIACCAVAGAAARRLGQPAVVGEIAAGIALGPSVLGAVWPAAMHAVFPARVQTDLATLAQFGVILFVFLAGLEMRPRLLRGNGELATVLSHVSIALPLLLGVLVAGLAGQRFSPAGVDRRVFALFVGVAMAVTALPVLLRILQDRGMARSPLGTLAVTTAVVDDVTAWTLLALIGAMARTASLAGVLRTVLLTALFALALLTVVRRAARRVVHALREREHLLAGIAVAAALAAAAGSDALGVQTLFGAFLMGLACPGDHPAMERVRTVIGGLNGALLLPIVFAQAGLHVQIGVLSSAGLWGWLALFAVAATAGKLGGAVVAARAYGVAWRPALQLGILLNCRGLTGLVVIGIGLQLGVINGAMFTILTVIALISTAITAPLLSIVRRGADPEQALRVARPEPSAPVPAAQPG